MSKYAAEHAGALADVAAAGGRIRFEAPQRLREDASGPVAAAAAVVVSGYATDAEGGTARYPGAMTGALVPTEGPVLLVVLDEYGASVPDGGTCEWGGIRYTVADRRPYAPDGTVLLTYVGLTR